MAGFHLRMAQGLTLWALEPDIGYTPTRAALGFVTNPTGTIDVVEALDAAYKGIVTAIPACDTEVKGLRQNEVWLAFTRKALDASNSGQLDSAEIFLEEVADVVIAKPLSALRAGERRESEEGSRRGDGALEAGDR